MIWLLCIVSGIFGLQEPVSQCTDNEDYKSSSIGFVGIAGRIYDQTLWPIQEKQKQQAKNATVQVTGALGWRSEGIKHKKNEVFLDIIEQVNLLVSSKGRNLLI